MKAWKVIPLAIMVLSAFHFAGCSGDKYGDMKEVMNAQTEAMEKYVHGLENAESAEDAASAINDFTSDMKVLIPEMKEAMAQHPEIDENDESPEELKTEIEALRAVSAKMQNAMAQIMQYAQDPSVQKAMEEQGKVMMELARK